MLSNQYSYRRWIYIDGKKLDLEAFIDWLYPLWYQQNQIERKYLTKSGKSHQNIGGSKYFQIHETGSMSSSIWRKGKYQFTD